MDFVPCSSGLCVFVLFSYVSAKLRNALPDFIRTYEFTGLLVYSGFSF